jgi:hypothetical protein
MLLVGFVIKNDLCKSSGKQNSKLLAHLNVLDKCWLVTEVR